MPISAVFVGNFKGLRDEQWIPIKPLTLVVGPNSSGKSSLIHALACLSQTIKLPNTRRPLCLDDEHAAVHLGRFIEVIHSKTYKDAISLGLEIPGVRYSYVGEKEKVRSAEADLRAVYSVKSTLRTQEVFLHRASITLGDRPYDVRRTKNIHEVTDPSGEKLSFELDDGFLLRPFLSRRPINYKTYVLFDPILEAQRAIQNSLQRTHYLGPFRQPPARRYPTRGANPIEVGSQGEAAVTMLANEVVQFQNRPHMLQVSEWLKTLGLAKQLDVARVGKSDLFGVNVTLRDDASFPIADLGYGVSQVLPVLTQCAFAEEGATLLFEQPEIHLHSNAARPLADVFADTIKKRVRIVAETHSPELVWSVVGRLREGKLAPADVVIYRAHRHGKRTILTALEIDSEELDIFENWESGISMP